MKKNYLKPEAIIVSFRAEDELMTGSDLVDPSASFGGGDEAPFSLTGFSSGDKAY